MKFSYKLRNGKIIYGKQDLFTGSIIIYEGLDEIRLPIQSNNGDLYFVYNDEIIYFCDVKLS